MPQDSVLEKVVSPENAPAPQPRSAEVGRIVSVDLLRGLVVALMALDHTRDFFGTGGFNPRDVTEPALFLTRWVTHFCAPTFVLLAGLSAFLYGRGRSIAETSRFLLTRGLWLMLIDLTLIKFGWRFEFDFLRLGMGVVFVIGASMVALAALVRLPRWAIAAVALIMIAGHNLLDGISAESMGPKAWLWHILHERGEAALGGGVEAYVLYPLIPWIGVMAAGYALGPVMQREAQARQRLLYAMGAAITLGFVLLRASDLYGDPASWTVEENWLATLLSFVNCEKYPPSLLFLMMTLGPALMLLAAFDQARGRFAQVLAMFGQVPFFFYLVHIYLIHALAIVTGFALTGVFAVAPRLGFSLPEIYLVWLALLALLYPICRWFAGRKARGTAWWWSYL
jgi:uncharacterized membrane protein